MDISVRKLVSDSLLLEIIMASRVLFLGLLAGGAHAQVPSPTPIPFANPWPLQHTHIEQQFTVSAQTIQSKMVNCESLRGPLPAQQLHLCVCYSPHRTPLFPPILHSPLRPFIAPIDDYVNKAMRYDIIYESGPQVPIETLLNFSSYWLNNTLYMITYVSAVYFECIQPRLSVWTGHLRHSKQPHDHAHLTISHTYRLSQEATLDPIPVCIELNLGCVRSAWGLPFQWPRILRLKPFSYPLPPSDSG